MKSFKYCISYFKRYRILLVYAIYIFVLIILSFLKGEKLVYICIKDVI